MSQILINILNSEKSIAFRGIYQLCIVFIAILISAKLFPMLFWSYDLLDFNGLDELAEFFVSGEVLFPILLVVLVMSGVTFFRLVTLFWYSMRLVPKSKKEIEDVLAKQGVPFASGTLGLRDLHRDLVRNAPEFSKVMVNLVGFKQSRDGVTQLSDFSRKGLQKYIDDPVTVPIHITRVFVLFILFPLVLIISSYDHSLGCGFRALMVVWTLVSMLIYWSVMRVFAFLQVLTMIIKVEDLKKAGEETED